MTSNVKKERRLRYGSLNCRGLNIDGKLKDLAEDMEKYRLSIMGIQETHWFGSDATEIESPNKKKFMIMYTGPKEPKKGESRRNYGGVGIICTKEISDEAAFKTISPRICSITINNFQHNKKLVFISTYAPTLPNSEKDPRIRDTFYEELDNYIQTINSRDILIISGDFNAKTGTGKSRYPNNIGKHGKGQENLNGTHLLEFACKNKLILTNTIFKHKMAHTTTWESNISIKPKDSDDFKQILVRNQIDYIIMKIRDRHILTDSRSYNGIKTNTDHRLIIADIHINKTSNFKPKKKKELVKQINRDNFANQEMSERYKEKVKAILTEKKEDINAENRWNIVSQACHQAAEESIGFIGKKEDRNQNNEEIRKLSELQHKIRLDINSTKDSTTKETLRKDRNKILNTIHKLKKEDTERNLTQQIEDIEKTGDETKKMFKAIKYLKMEGTKKTKLQVNTADGKTTSTTRKIEEVTNHFKQCFYNENLGPDQNKQETIKPEKITQPFTTEEIQKAIKKLKNNKAAGCDNIIAEQLKHSPEIVAEEIATIFNDMVRTGKYPEEIKKGILIPLQKPGKEKGPTVNLRPIMLMTMLRKTLALCMLERINPRIQENIPISQAAYRQGRSTTEQVQAFKLLAEKAITTEDTEYTITLIDMSKAFDTVNRKTLIEDLKHIVNKEELYILSKMINDTEIQVKIDGEVGQQFRTTEGVAQGEGLSPILFTLYLAKAFKEDSTTYPSQDHNYTSNAPEIHQLGFEMEEQYADDCGLI
eukprot:gene17828-9525_t